MSEAKHTAGPWYPRWGGEPGHVFSPKTGRLIATVPHEQSDATPQHDTRLLAAAPDLLAACKAALPALERAATELVSGYFAQKADLVRAVIAKAEPPPESSALA